MNSAPLFCLLFSLAAASLARGTERDGGDDQGDDQVSGRRLYLEHGRGRRGADRDRDADE